MWFFDDPSLVQIDAFGAFERGHPWVCQGLGALRWNGTAFAPIAADRNSGCRALWGRSPNDIWLQDIWVEHWDGQSSTSAPLPVAANYGSIWGNDRGVWVAGSFDNATYVWGWYAAAGTWTRIDVPRGYVVTGSGGDDIWALIDGGQAFHWDGATWTETTTDATG